ncbi:hypothetical protein FPQ18DRAFT_315084 [Pyronema domesticum]|nr:hypothetical protein FPQ18DRAFT_315084 [Pyronema domesticum]
MYRSMYILRIGCFAGVFFCLFAFISFSPYLLLSSCWTRNLSSSTTTYHSFIPCCLIIIQTQAADIFLLLSLVC